MNHANWVEVLEVFNMCILQGDSFLQSAGVYDDLYYELIRMHNLFQNLHEHGEHWLWSIVNHFNAKIAAFESANGLTSVTENQVLAVVRENYDSLTLRVHEDLDVPDSYVEEEDHLLFDTLVETVLKQTRKDCMDSSLQMQSYFHELSAIS
ncbi:unnamed protein product [Echinostoma caproni]|uniref:DUF1741 domain-containing protein n=1 Tax=Echinostoma caproni TaxID=27848 RepID=A0A183ADI1_9TREM|nr:unnamed protein product [Echinostoma caproni]